MIPLSTQIHLAGNLHSRIGFIPVTNLFATRQGRRSGGELLEIGKLFAGERHRAPGSLILKSLFQKHFVPMAGLVKMSYFAWFLREIFVDVRTHFAYSSY
jgi:hypothetical protein